MWLNWNENRMQQCGNSQRKEFQGMGACGGSSQYLMCAFKFSQPHDIARNWNAMKCKKCSHNTRKSPSLLSFSLSDWHLNSKCSIAEARWHSSSDIGSNGAHANMLTTHKRFIVVKIKCFIAIDVGLYSHFFRHFPEDKWIHRASKCPMWPSKNV